ncbi:hemin uptake protein HemP [Rhizobium sp. RU20A]|uniref:hemin uptake protein HemP n=1 Tax=Rhizobium sp. RU20A TaxID=1907412 RepID=UPI001FCF1463|nr:hemin uptake protein HemP [Rhizobium sp. RU20A]
MPETAVATDRKTAPKVVESRELFAGRSEILISHDGALYRMKITRQNKLILNK